MGVRHTFVMSTTDQVLYQETVTDIRQTRSITQILPVGTQVFLKWDYGDKTSDSFLVIYIHENIWLLDRCRLCGLYLF